MNSFPQGFRALVIGASGAMGVAFVECLRSMPKCALVKGVHRQSMPPVDFDDEGRHDALSVEFETRTVNVR